MNNDNSIVDKKNEIVSLRFTKEHKKLIEQAAKKNNQTLTEYITSCVETDFLIKTQETFKKINEFFNKKETIDLNKRYKDPSSHSKDCLGLLSIIESNIDLLIYWKRFIITELEEESTIQEVLSKITIEYNNDKNKDM